MVHDGRDDGVLPEVEDHLRYVLGEVVCGGGEDLVVEDAVCVCLYQRSGRAVSVFCPESMQERRTKRRRMVLKRENGRQSGEGAEKHGMRDGDGDALDSGG